MTIFRLNFLLKVGQIEMCQNPSFISTFFFQPNSAQKHDLGVKLNFILFSPKINEFHQKKFRPQRRNFPHSSKIWSGIFFFPEKKKNV